MTPFAAIHPRQRIRWTLLVALLSGLLALSLAGCTVSSSEGPAGSGPNEPPSIWSVTASRTVVLPEEEVVLAVNASDPNGDELSYLWEKSDGWFVDNNAYTWQVTWQAPDEVGEVTLNARVSDGFELTEQAIIVTVTSPPDAPFGPTPGDDETNVDPEEAVLSWSANTGEDGPLTYDVYFGSSVKPSLVKQNSTDTSYTRTDLDEFKRYYWKVIVKDEFNYQTSGPIWSFTTGTGNENPNAPNDPYPPHGATSIPTNVRLSWLCDDPNNDALTYDIKFGTTNPPVTVQFAHPSNLYTPLQVLAGTTYYWQVIAKDDSGGEQAGPVWSFSTSGGGDDDDDDDDNDPPGMPYNPVPAHGASDQIHIITMFWDCEDPNGDDLTYDVYFGLTANPTQIAFARTSNFWSPGYQLQANTAYYWKIVAEDDRGAETIGPVWTFITGASANNTDPDPPANPSPADNATSVTSPVTLTWTCTDPDSDILTYDVYYGTSNPPTTVIEDLATAFTILNSLSTGQVYFWNVVAKDGNGGETSGPIWSFTTDAAGGNTAPSVPSSPSPSDGATRSPGDITFTWSCTDVDLDPLTYDFWYGQTDPPMSSMQDLTTASATVNVPANSNFFWKVTADDGNGGFTAGPIWQLTTTDGGGGGNDPPNQPFSPSPGNEGTVIGNQVTLSWLCTDPDLDQLTFDVYAGTSDPPFLVSQNQTAYSYIYSSLTPGATYYWRVVAEDPDGEATSGPTWTFEVMGQDENEPPEEPHTPDPVDGAMNVDGLLPFTWQCSDPDEDPLTYDVYLGVTGQPLLVAQDLAINQYVVSQTLVPDTEYVWFIVASDDNGASTNGPVWTFTAGTGNAAPLPASDPSPADDASGVGLNPTLSWSGSDPDLDDIAFDVYFGTSGSPMNLVSEDQTGTTFTPGSLNVGSSYIWRIDTWDEHGAVTQGPQWSFTTSFTGTPRP